MALPHLQFFPLDFSELFNKQHIKPAAWSAVLAYSLVMVFDIGGAMFGLGNLAGEEIILGIHVTILLQSGHTLHNVLPMPCLREQTLSL